MDNEKGNAGRADDIINFAKSKLKDIKEGIDNVADKVKDATTDEDSTVRKMGDSIGSVARSAGTTIANLAKKLGKETGKLTRIAGLKADIASLSGQRKTKVVELGEAFLNVYRSDFEDKETSSKIVDIITSIDEIDGKISEKQDEIKRIQQEENLTDEEIDEIKE
ncbi:MAG: hypothetical protein QME46_05515 [Thermoanaerobacteraceae bacterium]|nr:hypothetical protein [Thermoanaerobacteraceae bacterium]